jgi:thioredoxin 1
MAEVAEVNDKNFAEATKNGVALVDFWAPWCAPCVMQGPIIEEVSEEAGAKAKVVKVNVDDAPQSAAQFGVRSIPTIIVFKDGSPAQHFVGVTQKKELLAAIESVQ